MREGGESHHRALLRDRCPTCGAPRRGEAVCHRCKSDLSMLIGIEHQADALRARARRCYARGWYRQAAALAGQITSLECSAQDLQLLACAYLMSGDFLAATAAYRRAHEKRRSGSPDCLGEGDCG